jgi:hypothetical protein
MESHRTGRPCSWVEYKKSSPHLILTPFLYSEWLASWAVFLLSRWTLLRALEYAGNLSLLVAVIFYFAETGDRTQARHYEAWQVINTAQGKGGSGGRIDALEQLNDDHVPLVGVDVSDAYLQEVELESADLRRSTLRGADLKKSRLKKADLEEADMTFANFREADMRRINLTDAIAKNVDFNGADLTGATLSGTNLDGTDLRHANIANVIWDRVSLTGARIAGIKNPPKKFVAWAIQHGAIAQSTDSTQP